MSRHQFRLLVVLHQVFVFVSLIVYEMTVGSLPPELVGYIGVGGSVVEEPGGGGLARGFTDWLYYAELCVSVVASLGLFLFKSWGRPLFLLVTIFFVLTTPAYESFVSTGWSAALTYVATLFEGMIIALIFFSHLRRLFTGAKGDEETRYAERERDELTAADA
ncbi:MAG TPA: hypothetical protein VGW12_22185 [Pyrinomonadaceae bacterium]|nr:hypothetical protein [Pyrinomonadaceae bacterium]